MSVASGVVVLDCGALAVLQDPSSDNNRDIDGPARRVFDLGDEIMRTPPEPSYHRHLFEAYNQRCLAGAGRQGKLVSSLRHFTTEDRIAFQKLSDFVLGDVAATVEFHGRGAENLGITPRFLHHRVLRDATYDEHHVFVELYDKELRPVVASRGCLDIFSAGPVAHHYILSDGCSVSEYRLVSRPAFLEATGVLCHGPLVSPFRTWAYNWLLESFRGATHLALRPDTNWKREIGDLKALEQGLESISVLGTPEQPNFVVDYEGHRYRMALWLDSRLSVPVCYRGPGQVV